MNLKRWRIFRLLGHWRWFVRYVIVQPLKTRMRMPLVLTRVRNKAEKERLRVLFVVGSLSKWKCQSLYDLMKKSDRFEPIIVLIICDADWNLTEEQRLSAVAARQRHFLSRGMCCEVAYLPNCGNVGLSRFRPDLVFYSQPWGVEDVVSTYETAKVALVFYVQYYVTLCESESSVGFACKSPFHRHLCAYFAQTQHLAELYRNCQGWFTATREFVGLGHPMLDQFSVPENPSTTQSSNYVIYAPHWTIAFPGSKNYDDCSTFMETGEAILEYAKQHPEFNWVFKPHPALRGTLRESRLWAECRIDEYYRQWERIGVVSEGEYVQYFNDSQALITDSLSFLYEYVCTGRPIIRLIHQGMKMDPPDSACGRLFGSYYLARTNEEMLGHFANVLEHGGDPGRDRRVAIAAEYGLLGNDAGEKIYEYLLQLISKRN